MPAGRPTKYDPAYCDEVMTALEDGGSLTAFAAKIGVARSTINKWVEDQPEFSEACARAKAKAAAWWEKQARNLVLEGGSSAQASMITLGLKNMGREDWQEKTLIGSDPENPLPEGFHVNLVGRKPVGGDE